MAETPQSLWVCPNDRQLALRAKLKTGWSVKTNTFNRYKKQKGIDELEQETIVKVIKRAEMIDTLEQERIGRLVDKLENMKKNAMGNGQNQCILCGDEFGFLGASALSCNDCKKAVCTKCGVDTSCNQKEPVWLCKICSETRETWKKSGAWFFKGLPKHILPKGKKGRRYQGNQNAEANESSPSQPARYYTTWARRGHLVESSGPESEESSDDDPAARMSRRNYIKDTESIGDSSDGLQSSYRSESQISSKNDSPSKFREHSSYTADQTSNPFEDENEYNLQSYANQSIERNSCDNIQGFSASGSELPNSRKGSVKSTTSSVYGSNPENYNERSRNHTEEEGRYSPHHSRQGSHHSVRSNQSLTYSDKHQGRELSASSEHRSEIHTKNAPSPNLNIGSPIEQVAVDQKLQNAIETATYKQMSGPRPVQEDQPSHLGSLEFSLLFDPIKGALHCTLQRAEGLCPMDSCGLADPYVKLHLLPGININSYLRTKTIHRTLKPEFNETLTYFGITEKDIVKRSLRLTVLNDDQFGHDFIGEAIISLQRLRAHQTKHFSVSLDHKLTLERDEDCVKTPSGSGKILIGLMYNTQRECLTVKIVSCSDIPSRDTNGLVDPFVKLQLNPDTYGRQYKTTVKVKNSNPQFNEEFCFETSPEDLLKRTLNISVWDKSKNKHGDYISGLELGIKSKGERLWHWLQTIQTPNRRMEKWHQLSSEAPR